MAIIAPLSSSSINERLRHFRYQGGCALALKLRRYAKVVEVCSIKYWDYDWDGRPLPPFRCHPLRSSLSAIRNASAEVDTS
jgi:hypothetical protein